MLMSRYQHRPRTKRVVVVTGATSGVGRAIVRELARPGVCLGLIARGLDGLRATQREVEQCGGVALMLPCDVADPEAVEEAATRVEESFGGIDLWINNAATSVLGPVHEISAREFERVTQVSYLGVVYGTLAALRRMRANGKGRIIQVGSALGSDGLPMQAACCGAKQAIEGFTHSLQAELAHEESDIGLTLVQLPAMNTPHYDQMRSKLAHKAQPVSPIYEPEVAARAIAWACTHDRPEIRIGTPTLPRMRRRDPDAIFDAQRTDQLEEPGRPDNLFEPVPGDRGAHGRFTQCALDNSVHLWASLHRGVATTLTLLGIFVVTAATLALTLSLV